jgi:DNA-binding NarL/FixJ family response regulator
MTRVLIADDDDLMRAGLVELLTADPDIEIVGQAATGHEAVEQARRLAPHVVLMDVRMPDLDGIGATRELARAVPDTKVLILTTFEQDDYIFGALRAGASGFLLKRTRPEDLISAVHTIAAGDSLLSPSGTRRVIDRMAQQPTPDHAGRAGLDALTPRAGDPQLHRPRHVQPRDRRRARCRGVDHPHARQAHPDETRPARPGTSRDLRVRVRDDPPRRAPRRPIRRPSPTIG